MSNIIDEVKNLKLPLGQYSVVGSGALSVRKIRSHHDIDLIVTDDLYEKLKKEGWEEREKNNSHFNLYKGNVEIDKNFLHINNCNLNTEEVIKNSDIFDDIPFMSLKDLVKLKKALGREKDIDDIESIIKYMNQPNII